MNLAWYEYILLILHIGSLFFLFVYSLGQLQLTVEYLRRRKRIHKEAVQPTVWPQVTVQLPVYNEKYVVERLIESVCDIDYPRDKLEIQVLDDSEDITSEIIAKKVQLLQSKGSDIRHIRRKKRSGFKAGALAYGLDTAKADFIAIFDADFIPHKNFLKETIPHFSNNKIGMVQTRWSHLNKDFSFFTKMQAFGLDAHFTIEQTSRNLQNSFINFNGTAGVWRKSCIEDAGGWSADTLTEDLDLSYRAQLKGWKFHYLENIDSPAELPVVMPAIKSQQYRWNKGAAENSRKLLSLVYKSNLSNKAKLHATFHLLNSSVFLMLMIAALTSIPMLWIKSQHPELDIIFRLGSILLIGFFAIGLFYWVASKKSFYLRMKGNFITTYLSFLTVTMGLALHNAIAVLEGLMGRRTPFIRTPKFNSDNAGGVIKGNSYLSLKVDHLTIWELLLGLFFIFGIALGIYLKDFGMIVFHAMLAIGFLTISYQSVKVKWHE